MPETYKNLYPLICGFDNLYLAHRGARRGGKRKHPEVALFEHDLGENLLRLQRELREQTYRHFTVVERKVRSSQEVYGVNDEQRINGWGASASALILWSNRQRIGADVDSLPSAR